MPLRGSTNVGIYVADDGELVAVHGRFEQSTRLEGGHVAQAETFLLHFVANPLIGNKAWGT